ncbi:MurR/RpiR family transcriptional regulator [Staphylococcus pettenkoferi]|uniref:MurR/RpiR family transcriptional regulator n=1 Tax=Staphylococcus pettenkoferi TaxID=170573 RepID=A0A9Q4H1G2_9STAP|nr:MurR/RpiR family transcriptional regulator [Staphylococcus pettenkoferi]MCY1569288.1 MurR/RpiR family transcriptional regulator [Staphylococcus pettenkoferi]MCY1576161.1 MurR/RpiR family transcriptional regulator [Staphylococcus pettenkoferi]MCY1593953.1 MurR/RpiR family transcriptional regulator [Staphylococcus pettenkoferi]MCY1617448.1 MurR/RpiR family transcriptional regulator [Staphylococcus pettenkoferi]
MTNNIIENIESVFTSLTSGKKKVANYILNHSREASYLTLAKLQEVTEVSEATIIRFAYTIGYGGYTDMQNAIREYVFDGENKTPSVSKSTVETMEHDRELIQEMANLLDLKRVDDAVTILHQDRTTYVIGNNTAYGAAHWFSHVMSNYKSNVIIVDRDQVNKYLMDVSEKDCVVAISFPRYHKNTVHFIKNAKKQKAYVIGITDSRLSPIYDISDKIFLAKTNRDISGYNEIAPVISLLNVIVTRYRERFKEEVNSRIQSLEKLNDSSGDLIE